jgi:hypothetical protein
MRKGKAMEALQNLRNVVPVWKIGGLAASGVLCVWTLAALPGALITGIIGIIVAGGLLALVLAEQFQFLSAGAGDTTAERVQSEADGLEWDDTLDTLRDQVKSVSQSINDALCGADEEDLEEGEGSVEEKITRLFEALNDERDRRNAAIKRALTLERDAWNRTFGKKFTERLNEVLRHVKSDRDEAVSTAAAAERKAWREALEERTAELIERFETQKQELVQEARHLVEGAMGNAGGDEDETHELAMVAEGGSRGRSARSSSSSGGGSKPKKKASARKPSARQTGGRKRGKRKSK